MNFHVQNLRSRIENVKRTDELSEHDIWNVHGPLLWEAERFRGQPSFYPVYRAGNVFSYSPLALILLKGHLRFDAKLARDCYASSYRYLSGRGILDRDIERIGGPVTSTNIINSSEVYIERIAHGLAADVGAAERANPGCTNIVMCGGKDSLNLLLLPWRNPTFAVSAPPNYELVRQFVRENSLEFDVVRLDDLADDRFLDAEVMENGCRNILTHCRWGGDLQHLAKKHDERLIFWKGQLGDLFMTPHWKEVAHPPGSLKEKFRKAYTRLAQSGSLPKKVTQRIDRAYLEPRFREVIWTRSAMWQGAHVSLLRALTNCLVLSAYHGPEMTKVLSQVDLASVVTHDVRECLGASLHGTKVRYPTQNPGPSPSQIRKNRSSPDLFLSLLQANGVKITQ